MSERERPARGRGPRDSAILESPLSATWQPRVRERAVLVGVGPGISDEDLDELAALADSAGAETVSRIVQSRKEPDPGTFIGRGKIEELHRTVHGLDAESVILDQELTPGQLRNLEERLGVKVIDRTALILDIFALHARSREGKAQVELAQLNYLLPRLRGWGEAMSRLGGGIGTRGPGRDEDGGRPSAHPPADREAPTRHQDAREDARPQARAPTGFRDPAGRDRRLHERRQVDAHEPTDGGGGDRGRPALRDARSHDAPDRAPRPAPRRDLRHGRVRRASFPTTSWRRSGPPSKKWRWPT